MSQADLSRRDRLAVILDRDGADCVWCRRSFGRLVVATTEHVIPRVKGGPSWLENEVAACRRCNAARGHRPVGDWMAECERRGWQPNRPVITRALDSLAAAIEARGGQRRARRHLASQLRRVRS